MFRLTVCLSVLGLLTACGGGGGGTSDTRDGLQPRPGPVQQSADADGDRFESVSRAQFIDELAQAQASVAQISTLPETRFDPLPTSGRATFDGKGGVYLDPVARGTDDDILLLGDARLVASFGRGTVSGRITDFIGVEGTERAGQTAFGVNGEIEIGARGSSIGTGRPNAAAATYDGSLRTDGFGTVNVRGNATGGFLGTRAARADTPDAPKALALEDGRVNIRRGGRQVDGAFFVYGQN